MCHLGDIKQIRHQLTHHLTGIILIIIGEGQLLIMIKKLLTHIPFHIGSHHMSLIADIIFAKPLNDVHEQHSQTNGQQSL